MPHNAPPNVKSCRPRFYNRLSVGGLIIGALVNATMLALIVVAIWELRHGLNLHITWWDIGKDLVNEAWSKLTGWKPPPPPPPPFWSFEHLLGPGLLAAGIIGVLFGAAGWRWGNRRRTAAFSMTLGVMALLWSCLWLVERLTSAPAP